MPTVLTKKQRDVVEVYLVVPRQILTDLILRKGDREAVTAMMVAAVGEWYGGEKGLGGASTEYKTSSKARLVSATILSCSCEVTITTVRKACLGKTCAHLLSGSKSAMAANLPTNTLDSSVTNSTTWILRVCGPNLGYLLLHQATLIAK